MDVNVTVTVGNRTVPLAQVRDNRIAGALRATAKQVSSQLEKILCPVHAKAATEVRLHFNASGVADLKYESCCDKLGAAIRDALG